MSIEIEYLKNLASGFQSKPLYLDETIQKKPNTQKLIQLLWKQLESMIWNFRELFATDKFKF